MNMNYEREAGSPSQSSLNKVRNAAKQITSDVKSVDEWFRLYAKNHEQRLAFDIDIAKRLLDNDSIVLEVGSSPFVFTTALGNAGYDVTGVDLSPERFDSTISKLDLKVLKCDIETQGLPIESEVFDAVIFNEMLEHLRINPIFTLRELKRVLKPGGKILLSTPNLKSLYGIYNYLIKDRAFSCSGVIYDEYERLDVIGHMGHVREYTKTEVMNFLERIGFEVETIIYRGRYNNKVYDMIAERLLVNLSPFISYIGVKK